MESKDADQLKKALAKRLRELRKQRGLSQHRTADELIVSRNAYAEWERETSAPRLDKLVLIANHYNITLDDLLGLSEPYQASMSVRGVSWQLAWSKPDEEQEKAAGYWHLLVQGEKVYSIAQRTNVNYADIERNIQNLILHDSIYIEDVTRDSELEEAVKRRFRQGGPDSLLREVRVAKVGDIDLKLVRFVLLGHVAKDYFTSEVKSGSSVGLCGGFAVSRMVYSLLRGECPAGLRVYPIAVSPLFENPHISANSLVGALAYRHYGLGLTARELPFFLAEEMKDTTSPSAQLAIGTLDDAAAVDFVFMGVGGKGKGALARNPLGIRQNQDWWSGNTLSGQLENSNAVGNILYYLIDENGKPPEIFRENNERLVCSIGLNGLQNIVNMGKRVVVIALGADKAEVTRLAVQNGYANVLIIDDGLAKELVASVK